MKEGKGSGKYTDSLNKWLSRGSSREIFASAQIARCNLTAEKYWKIQTLYLLR